jgi:membrane fusion protein (multidrug efflux system)
LEVTTTATGSLLGRESVALVSELSRRLVRVWATEGKQVKQGELLFELDAQDLRAEVVKLDVDAKLAAVTAERAARLQKEGIANQEELDLAQAKVEQLNAQRNALQVTIAKTRIRAPFAGTLGLRRVSEGAWLTPTTVLTTLQDTSQLKVDFTLPERYASAVAIGTEFRFRVASRADTLSGKIVAIEPAVDTNTRSLSVRGLVAEGHALVPGTAVDVELPLRVDRVLMVPAIALQSSVDGRRVFVVQPGTAETNEPYKLKSVLVEVGFRSAERVQLLSGVNAGDQVVVSNLLRLRDGASVEVEAGQKP